MIIVCEHAVETLTYFSRQLAQAFAEWGYEIFWMDFDKIGLSAWKLRRKMQENRGNRKKTCRQEKTVLITFNFIGLSGENFLWDEDADGLPAGSIWEQLGIACLNIMVDHPIYYCQALRHPVPGLHTFCIDRDHVAYMKRFYPKIRCEFLPLAGNILPDECPGTGNQAQQPGAGRKRPGAAADGGFLDYPLETFETWCRRPYPLVFTANYVPAANIERQFLGLEPEYRDFYYEIIRSFLHHPKQDLLSGMEPLLRREMPELSEEQLCEVMSNMPAVDLWIRTYFREKTVRILAEAGIKVYLFGKDWDQITCSHPENLIHNGRMADSAECVRAMAGARLALNTMPWFKDGAHDRIFTAMLQGAAALTDTSRYLEEQFTDRQELFYYDLCDLEQLPELVKALQQEPERVYEAACRGRNAALRCHTWKSRAEVIRKYIS